MTSTAKDLGTSLSQKATRGDISLRYLKYNVDNIIMDQKLEML